MSHNTVCAGAKAVIVLDGDESVLARINQIANGVVDYTVSDTEGGGGFKHVYEHVSS